MKSASVRLRYGTLTTRLAMEASCSPATKPAADVTTAACWASMPFSAAMAKASAKRARGCAIGCEVVWLAKAAPRGVGPLLALVHYEQGGTGVVRPWRGT